MNLLLELQSSEPGLLEKVMRALEAGALDRISRTCRFWHDIELRDRATLWRALSLARWPEQAVALESGVMALSGVDWKRRYEEYALQERNKEKKDPVDAALLNKEFDFFFEASPGVGHAVLTMAAPLQPRQTARLKGRSSRRWGRPTSASGQHDLRSLERVCIELWARDKATGQLARLCSVYACEDAEYAEGVWNASGEVVLADQPDDNGVEALCFVAHREPDPGGRSLPGLPQTEFTLVMIRHCEGLEDGPSRREMPVHEFARDILRRGAGLRWIPGA